MSRDQMARVYISAENTITLAILQYVSPIGLGTVPSCVYLRHIVFATNRSTDSSVCDIEPTIRPLLCNAYAWESWKDGVPNPQEEYDRVNGECVLIGVCDAVKPPANIYSDSFLNASIRDLVYNVRKKDFKPLLRKTEISNIRIYGHKKKPQVIVCVVNEYDECLYFIKVPAGRYALATGMRMKDLEWVWRDFHNEVHYTRGACQHPDSRYKNRSKHYVLIAERWKRYDENMGPLSREAFRVK